MRGTIRNASDPKRLAEIESMFADHMDSIELVSMDLIDTDSVIKATDGVDFVLHVANPLGMKGDEDFFVKPAVEGTKALLRGCKLHGVKRMIVTSSMACIADEKRD